MATENDDKKLNVPKFSSFKPKEFVPVTDRRKEKHLDGERSEGESSRKHNDKWHHDGHRRKKSHQDSRDHRNAHHHGYVQKSKPETRPVLHVPGLYVIDKKGDPLIRKFGLDRSKVPAYHRRMGNRALGTDGHLLRHHDGPAETFSLIFPDDSAPSFGDRGGLWSRLWVSPNPVRLRPRRDHTPIDDEGNYLPLERPKKRRRQLEDDGLHDGKKPSEKSPSWRSLESKAEPIGNAEQSDRSSNASAVEKSNEFLKQKSRSLSMQVKQHPENISAWLELVNHQDALLRDSETMDKRATTSAVRSFNEIKVHLLESALANVSSPEDRQRVLVALMREGIKVWSGPLLKIKWQQAAKDEEGNFALWKLRLNHSMSSVATAQYDEIKHMMLCRLRLAQTKIESSESVMESIYIFLRATRFFYDVGFRELAVAAWQGLLELNLFSPQGGGDQVAIRAAFETFWESEVPRIGEYDAQGWKHFVEKGHHDEVPELKTNDSSVETFEQDEYVAWGVSERTHSHKAVKPARTMDADTDDDPFRVVTYADIEPWLFVIPQCRLRETKQSLVDAFLLFCGLQPAFRDEKLAVETYHDQYLAQIQKNNRLKLAKEVRVEEASKRKLTSFDNGSCCARVSPSLLFGGKKWFQYLSVTEGGEQLVDPSMVENTLRLLVDLAGMSRLATYYLGFCFSWKSDGIKRRARTLLNRHSADVQLFNAYALAELANDHDEVASKVLISAMKCPELCLPSTGFLLFKTWSWMALDKGDIKLALQRLCASVDKTLRSPSRDQDVLPATILKARQAFSPKMYEDLDGESQERAVNHAECLVLLSYLTGTRGTESSSTSQGNISTAMAAVGSMLKEIEHEFLHERICQFAAQLLYLHSIKGPFRRVYIRDQLVQFIERFPKNTLLLSLFEWADASLRVIDETRLLLYDKVLVKEHDSVSSRVFAILHEMEHGNVHSTRCAFEHAVMSEACRSNVGLWLWFIRFSGSQKALRAKAKDVFYQALRHCPWSKVVMMEAFRTLAYDMQTEELRSVYNAMASKGLRIHVDLDDFLERRKEKTRER